MSQNYDRARTMVLMDKYNGASSDFYAEFTTLAKRYFIVDAIRSDAYCDGDLQINITLAVKKVKDNRRPQS